MLNTHPTRQLNKNDYLWSSEFCEENSLNDHFDDEGIETITSKQQIKVEESVKKQFRSFREKASIDPDEPVLFRVAHIEYLEKQLTHLPRFYECLDASRPWLCYWIVHGLDLLKHPLTPVLTRNIVRFLQKCQNDDGGFGGGPGQMSHLAPTYAAVNALCSLSNEGALAAIQRVALKAFLRRLRCADGSFRMHEGGEVDIRGLYCALSVARLTNVHSDDLFDGSAQWIVTCQTYEGGFAGVPGLEAHGGYAFCAVAALSLLRKEHLCNVDSLLRWTVFRQMSYEGGFQGRTNKLVDGCYSFWQGGAFPIVQRILCVHGDGVDGETDRWLFESSGLQRYVLLCCQHAGGGLLDKPTKPRDIYHSCYTLSGLSVAQHQPSGVTEVLGSEDNLLEPVHPLYNIGLSKVKLTTDFFMKLPVPT